MVLDTVISSGCVADLLTGSPGTTKGFYIALKVFYSADREKKYYMRIISTCCVGF